jgi:uncharacterized protein (TIGR02145 family)
MNKKASLFCIVTLFAVCGFAQTVTLTFTGRDAANHHVQAELFRVANLSKNWQEYLYWPDTVLTLQKGSGIQNPEMSQLPSLELSPNSPNPFHGITDIHLTLADAGEVTLDIADVGGRLVWAEDISLKPGSHQFRITLAHAGTYVMSARLKGELSSVKMVCDESGGAYALEYVGHTGTESRNVPSVKSHTRGTVIHPYDLGDQMEYSAYATINGQGEESPHIEQPLADSQTVVLHFSSVQLRLPTVVTANVTNITGTSAVCGGIVTDDGGDSVTARGVCVSISPNPTLVGLHTSDGSGLGVFTSQLTGLMSNLVYYVRAYATNAAGTAYGEEQSFVIPVNSDGDTWSCPGTPFVVDIDGNMYNTVQVGQQCWMRENLRTTRYADGTLIPKGETYSLTTAYWYFPMNESGNKDNYGLLYNWAAVMHNANASNSNPSGVQGICPDGWHVPSNAEWEQLHTYVKNHGPNVCGGIEDQIGKSLAATMGWDMSGGDPCEVGNANPATNNATGFSALPAGYYQGGNYSTPGFANYGGLGYNTFFWTSTKKIDSYGYSNTYYWGLHMNYASVIHNNFYDTDGDANSVRCVKD